MGGQDGRASVARDGIEGTRRCASLHGSHPYSPVLSSDGAALPSWPVLCGEWSCPPQTRTLGSLHQAPQNVDLLGHRVFAHGLVSKSLGWTLIQPSCGLMRRGPLGSCTHTGWAPGGGRGRDGSCGDKPRSLKMPAMPWSWARGWRGSCRVDSGLLARQLFELPACVLFYGGPLSMAGHSNILMS